MFELTPSLTNVFFFAAKSSFLQAHAKKQSVVEVNKFIIKNLVEMSGSQSGSRLSLGYLRNDESFQTFLFYCRLEQEYYYRQEEEGRMESEVELDSDHDDGEHDLSHGHWMGHPEDPNKVGHSQGQTV